MSDARVMEELQKYAHFTAKMVDGQCVSLSFYDEKLPLGSTLRRNTHTAEILKLIARLPALEHLNLRKAALGAVLFPLATRSLKVLDLSCNGLTHVPSWVLKQKKLQELNLGANQLTEIPPLYHLPLTTLKLHKNRLTKLGGIGRKLTCLNLYLNPFPAIPKCAYRQNNLQIFSYGMAKQDVVESFACWPDLEWLTIASTQLTELPDDIGLLTKLRGLILAKNQLCRIPQTIGWCSSLRICSLYYNQLRQLPDCFYKLPLLQLNIAKNPFIKKPTTERFPDAQFFRN